MVMGDHGGHVHPGPKGGPGEGAELFIRDLHAVAAQGLKMGRQSVECAHLSKFSTTKRDSKAVQDRREGPQPRSARRRAPASGRRAVQRPLDLQPGPESVLRLVPCSQLLLVPAALGGVPGMGSRIDVPAKMIRLGWTYPHSASTGAQAIHHRAEFDVELERPPVAGVQDDRLDGGNEMVRGFDGRAKARRICFGALQNAQASAQELIGSESEQGCKVSGDGLDAVGL